MEFSCEGQNGGNNGGIMMYNYGVDHRELCGQFLVLTWVKYRCSMSAIDDYVCCGLLFYSTMWGKC